MARKIKASEAPQILRPMAFFSNGEQAPWRITQQIDHTWFMTTFGEKEIGRPFDANEFLEFVHKNYDEGAVFKLASYGVANDCVMSLYFTNSQVVNEFLSDWEELLQA
jgi:hypothetical protein